ncbi:MAG TPA: SDR family oxidoreductase [Chitinophagaceae bacterium]|nr:SDR family oxidoreductase [Chitinophagaceae bacterium]
MFAGRTAIITGAGQGIGFTIARKLAAHGVNVVLNDIDPALAEIAATAIMNEGGSCMAYPGDASDVEFIRKMVADAVANYGAIHYTVANAGITTFGDFFEYTPESMQKLLQLNMAGTFFLAQASALEMRKTGGGSILLMSSVVGVQAHKYLAAYAMTKAAIQMLAKNLVLELSPYHIRINSISPGATITERTLAIEPEYEQTWKKITPLGKPATTEDIANTAIFFLSDQASHITGQNLIIDGGWTSVSPAPGEEHFKDVKKN